MADLTRYGLIGCGMMGHEHIENIALLPNTCVTAIVEPDPDMRGLAADAAPQARFYDSTAEMLAAPDLDCLVIASPNHLHSAQLQDIAHQRPLPILVEKPLLTDPADLAAVDTFASSYPCPVWVAMEYRYMPPISEFLDQVTAATGGIKMLTIQEHRFPFLDKVGHWNRFSANTGGTFVEKCCHFFDLMRLALRSEPLRVMASGGQDVNHLDEIYDGAVPDILDNGYVLVDFANGSRAMLELCMFAEGAEYQEVISATGPNGKIEVFVPGPGRFWPPELGPAPVPRLITSPRAPRGPVTQDIPVDPVLLDAGDHNGSTFYQHQKFLDIVRTGGTPEVSVHDGKMAVLMGMAAQRSIAQHRCVELAEFL